MKHLSYVFRNKPVINEKYINYSKKLRFEVKDEPNTSGMWVSAAVSREFVPANNSLSAAAALAGGLNAVRSAQSNSFRITLDTILNNEFRDTQQLVVRDNMKPSTMNVYPIHILRAINQRHPGSAARVLFQPRTKLKDGSLKVAPGMETPHNCLETPRIDEAITLTPGAVDKEIAWKKLKEAMQRPGSVLLFRSYKNYSLIFGFADDSKDFNKKMILTNIGRGNETQSPEHLISFNDVMKIVGGRNDDGIYNQRIIEIYSEISLPASVPPPAPAQNQLKTASYNLAAKFSSKVTKQHARNALNATNNDLAKAGKMLLDMCLGNGGGDVVDGAVAAAAAAETKEETDIQETKQTSRQELVENIRQYNDQLEHQSNKSQRKFTTNDSDKRLLQECERLRVAWRKEREYVEQVQAQPLNHASRHVSRNLCLRTLNDGRTYPNFNLSTDSSGGYATGFICDCCGVKYSTGTERWKDSTNVLFNQLNMAASHDICFQCVNRSGISQRPEQLEVVRTSSNLPRNDFFRQPPPQTHQ